jgi:hypothetical protein
VLHACSPVQTGFLSAAESHYRWLQPPCCCPAATCQLHSSLAEYSTAADMAHNTDWHTTLQISYGSRVVSILLQQARMVATKESQVAEPPLDLYTPNSDYCHGPEHHLLQPCQHQWDCISCLQGSVYTESKRHLRLLCVLWSCGCCCFFAGNCQVAGGYAALHCHPGRHFCVSNCSHD